MYNCLYKFLLENNTLYQKQFGFQNAHSTEHAILQLVNQITEAFSQGKFTVGIFLDISKAFDIVNHNILLEKLKAYEIQSENLKWFRSYLLNRKQFILYDDFKIEVKIVKCGVPQGSILQSVTKIIETHYIFIKKVHKKTLGLVKVTQNAPFPLPPSSLKKPCQAVKTRNQ